MDKSKRHEPTGIINPKAAKQKLELVRFPPPSDLSFFLERYWLVRWDLRGEQPYLQQNIPFPCVNLIVDQGTVQLFGVVTRKFTYLLEGKGQVFGVKFKPGAFYPFIKSTIADLTNTSIRLEDAFGEDGLRLERQLLSTDVPQEMIDMATQWLRARLPDEDENVTLVNAIVDLIVAEKQVTKVDHILERYSMSKRTLQRLFSDYVGVSPKWVIKRYRLQEALEALADGDELDWATLAVELGYFDQSHFIRDFKDMIGHTPVNYVKQADLSLPS